MEEYIVKKEEAGLRADKFLAARRPDLSRIFLLKAMRLKKIRRNGKRTEGSERLEAGDVISCRLPAPGEAPVRTDGFIVVYEDEHILAVNKKRGLLCEDRTGREKNTLLAQVNAYLAAKGERASLCHRIDYNTAGLVLLAKDGESLSAMEAAIRERLPEKRYLCAAVGPVRPKAGRLTGQIFKDAKKNRVYVTDAPVKGSKTAVTDYRVLAEKDGLSLVECTLVTGRTHQIRSQMAHAGWPILGDEKYGSKAANQARGERRQLLSACAVTLHFGGKGGILSYLEGKTVTAPADFRKKYFGK